MLALFDIDKTLVVSKGLYTAGFETALKRIYGKKFTPDIKEWEGKSDRKAIITTLEKAGIPKETIMKRLPDAEHIADEESAKLIKKMQIKLLPGVKTTLNFLKKQGTIIGVVTGNLPKIANAKMEKVSLCDYFPFGGFGSDGAERSDIVRAALRRAKNFGWKDGRAFIFGDTPHDIVAAQENGAIAVGLTTGSFKAKELYLAGADFVLEKMDAKKVAELMGT